MKVTCNQGLVIPLWDKELADMGVRIYFGNNRKGGVENGGYWGVKLLDCFRGISLARMLWKKRTPETKVPPRYLYLSLSTLEV